MTQLGHGVIRDHRDLVYDPKGHGNLYGRFAIFTGEDPQSEWMKLDESNRVYLSQTRILSLVYL